MARLLANGHTLRAFDHAFLHRERAFQSDARRPRSHDAALFSLARALVFFTGFCEIAGAVGLLFSLTRRAAGFASFYSSSPCSQPTSAPRVQPLLSAGNQPLRSGCAPHAAPLHIPRVVGLPLTSVPCTLVYFAIRRRRHSSG